MTPCRTPSSPSSMKKQTLLLIGLLALVPPLAHAESDSITCNPAIECNANQDYYAGSCKPRITNVANDCPAAPFGFFSAFSCNYGCYVRSRPEFQECAGGVMVDGQCLTSLYVVNKEAKNYVWDGVQLVEIGGGGVDGLWKTDNNTDIYRDTGKVGIGTNTPNYSLDIAGDLNLNKGKSGAALYASSRQMLWYNPDPALNWVTWGLDADKNFFPKKVGIGVLPDEDYDLEVNGKVSINKGGNGSALYASGRQMLWYHPDPALNFAAWGADTKSNLFGSPVGIGALNDASSSKLLVSNTAPVAQFATLSGIDTQVQNTQDGSTYGLTTNVTNNGTGTTYSSSDIAFKSKAGTLYGDYNFVQHSGVNNTNKAYGVYGNAYNTSSSCVGPDCAEAIGVFGTSGNSYYGTGGYFEGGNYGAHVVGKSSSLSTVGLFVENKDSNSPAAVFECTGDCTSGIFKDGNDSTVAIPNSGIVLIGEPGAAHISLDKDGIMAKSNSTTAATLSLNPGGDGDVLINLAQNLFATSVCRSGEILGQCGSLRAMKKNIHDLEVGLSTLMQLRPVSFDWKDSEVTNNQRDLGFIAEEVEAIDPLLSEYNEGQLIGVKYEKLTALLTKAVQQLKEEKDAEIKQLKATNEALKKLVCSDHPQAQLCQ